jgi:hypothetical protein
LSQYELFDAVAPGIHVYLWGFGAFIGGDGEGIFISRNDFIPRRTSGRIELHSKDNLPFPHYSSRLDLLLLGTEWFAAYEDWIARRMPGNYRDECLKTFKRKAIPATELAARWRGISCELQSVHA